jgi:hypothetical protein
MLQRLQSLFRGPSAAECFAEELAALEKQIERVPCDQRAELFAHAAERCAAAGDGARARPYFGRVIDASLECGSFDAAALLCQRLISLYPQVVRARGTLAFLVLTRGLPRFPCPAVLGAARHQLTDYLNAAHRAGREALAAERLRLMAGVTDRHDLRELIAEALLDLGDGDGAERVLAAIIAERARPQPPAATDQGERWARALRVSLVSPRAA